MKFLIKQPLIHFLLIGLALFLIYEFTSTKYQEADSKKVIVDQDALLTFMQYRSKAFNKKRFEEKLNNLSDAELKLLIDDYVKEEVLYREAMSLNLDKNDYILRRRLVQKIEFINEGFVNSAIEITEDDIKNYFEDNKETYKVEPFVTFTHVFFSNEIHGREKAKLLALNELKILNDQEVSFSDSVQHGDRFLYHLNYVERTPDYISSHFGSDMAKSLFKLEPSETIWHGPFESLYGSHLVMLTTSEKARYPDLDEVYDRVKQDVTYKITREEKEKSIQEIIDGYDIKIVYKNSNNTKSDTVSLHTEPE